MEQCSENHVTLASSCESPQLADGNSTKEHSNDQKLMERESPDSPSPVKRWEIGPLLQSFKSKMASFTEIVMSPVRLFKPTDTLSSIVHPDQDEKLIESNEETSAWTEEGETTDDKCKNELLSKRLSSERVQCISPPKRHRVAQRLNFETISTSNHESVLECNQTHKDIKEDQTTRPATQLQTVLQDKKCNPSFCTTQSTVLNSESVPSPDRPLNSSHDLHGSSQANFKINLLKGEDTDRSGSEESCSRAIRKSPRKALKHVSETAAELESSGSGPKTLNDRMKLHTNNVKEQMHHSTKVSDPPKSTFVGHVRSKRCREALRNNTKKDMVAKRKPDLRKAEDRGLRRAKNKKVKDCSITLEESQEDVICVQMRKKRKGITTEQKLQDPNNGLNTADVKIRYSETSESCDSTEMKEIGQVKSLKTHLRKNIKCKTLLTSSNEGDTETASQNKTGNVLIDKSLHCSNMNTIIDYEDYKNSTPSDLKTHKAEKTRARKTRHIFKTPGEASIQKRIVRPPKHKFEDYSTTLVVDPAGPSRPSKRTLYQSDHSCVDSRRTIIADEQQVTSLCGPETREDKNKFALPAVQPESTVSLRSEKERKPSRPTKTVNRPKRKLHISAKRINGGKDIPEQMMEAIPIESLSGSGFNRLLRSYSCPELPSLVFSDCHVPPSPTHEKYSTSNTNKSTAVPSHLHSPFKRTRRHTVCSVEIEREIAPLCLRKEVYPSSRGSHSSPYSPSNSLTALASCFLSSPLAFLSKNSSHERGHASDISTSSAYSDAFCFTSGYVTSSSPSLCSSPFASTLASSNPDPVVTPSPKILSASVSSLCSSSQGALEGDLGILQMECRRAMDEERSSFSLQLSTAISEEKAFSDSEIKTDIKEGQGGKVSSIRICRKIPKPQNNLTPMGLPKVIRIKKKDFSLEEIYTNKNFSKPPDGRLETIFEVPLNRRDGSQVVAGQKKVKRFVEFPELGVARKPKKPLVGGTAGGGAQRKAGGNSGICRTRRGVGASSKVEDGLALQELDTLLCSKLQELDTWMALQQVAC